MKVALGIAAGFFAGVLLVAILGGAKPARTATVTVATPQEQASGAPSPTAPQPVGVEVPDVTGLPLDEAADRLTALGLRADPRGGGLLGIVVEENWTVVGQDPIGTTRVEQGRTVVLEAERR